jgi:hypothetical protein
MSANGNLKFFELSEIPHGRLAKGGPARSWIAMRYYIGKKHKVWIYPTGPNSSYRTYAKQQEYYKAYLRGDGPLAARPGNSNHGLGLAVDIPSEEQQALVRKYGHRFGWGIKGGKLSSDAPSEAWHCTYRSYPARAKYWYARHRTAASINRAR